ncbi:MAG TPA: rhomboid family intramembrane serine protease [Thermoleophilaceae bacterium]|nr:rhomboid family intramembrane serine protease [Thermoleophilaceae bacterium]
MFPIKDNIPTRRFPVLTLAIIVACVFVYFGVERGGIGLGETGDEVVVEYGAVPYELTHPGENCEFSDQQVRCGEGIAQNDAPWWLTVLTSMFLHGGLLHLVGNMLFLWIFGNNIEDSMGRVRFALFYVAGGVAALLAQTLLDTNAAVPTVGASGAIAAVLGGYAVLYPRARVVTVVFIIILFTIIELPALLVLGLWFLIQVFYGASELGQPLGGGGGVAYFAHIGGFVFGLLLIKLFADRVHEDYDAQGRIPVY